MRLTRDIALYVTVSTAVLAAPASVASAFEPLPRSTPEERNVDGAAIEAAFEAAEDLGYVYGMVVARDGYVIGSERWSVTEDTPFPSASVTKSIMSILIGIAIDQGLIEDGIYARLVDCLPAGLVPADPDKHEIRLWHLLTMTSGLEWDDDSDFGPWVSGADPVGDILSRPMAAPPGTRWNYNSAASHLLSVVLTEAAGMSTLEFADAYLFGPLGITNLRWERVGGYYAGGHGIHLLTEDLVKFGVLFTNGGWWAGEQIVPSYWINLSTRPVASGLGDVGAFTDRGYGFLWWTGEAGEHRAFTAWGFGGQSIFCVPGLDLVVATHARANVSNARAGEQHEAIFDIIINRIVPATTDRRVFSITGLHVPEMTAVDDVMRNIMQAHDIRDVTVAVTKDGRLVYSRGFTWDEPDVEPAQPTALFRIGSIGKAVASIAVHQLIERGLLGHEALVTSMLDLQPLPDEHTDPWLDTVTVDHFLTHTSGMYSEDDIYSVSDKVSAAAGAGPPPTKEEMISFIVSRPFLFEPGTDWDYNNYGYIALDMLLENLTGEEFVNYVLDEIFRPVGVGRARQAHQLEIELAPTEVDYDGLEGDPYRSIQEVGTAPGGWVMAAPDLARLFSALFDSPDAGGIVAPSTRDEMLDLPFPVAEEIGYGRGWMGETALETQGVSLGSLSDPDDGLSLHGHSGGGSGIANLAFWRSDGMVAVMFSNKDPVADAIDFPEITVWPEHDLWGSVGVSLEPVGAAETEVWIPVVASAEGRAGSIWRSDVGLLNRSALTNHVKLRLYRSSAFFDHELELAPGENRTLGDVMALFGKTGSGALRIFSSEPLTATSRTYNLTPDGTFGQFLGSAAPTRGIETGESAVLMQLQENDAFRTNIGITNGWKRPAEIEVSLYDGHGAPVATISRTVPPERTIQLNQPFLEFGGRMDIGTGYAIVHVQFGQHVFAYSSVVDNRSNDPTTIPMKVGAGSVEQWVAAAAHVAGEFDSQWRTDLYLLNRSSATATAEVRYRGDDGTAETSVEVLEPGAQLLLADVVSQLGADGGGSLQVFSDQPVLVSSRTYNSGDEGTFGQFLDGTSPAITARAGQTVWLPQLQQNDGFRTNIGLVNSGDIAASVRIALFDGDSTRLATRNRTLAPYERLQIQEPFSRIAGRDDLDTAYASVTVEAGEGIIAYGSVIDNATNDPTTLPMAF
jgi:CubicO group peptidase (beta-lactamase class C family)